MMTLLNSNNPPRLSPLQERHNAAGAQWFEKSGWHLPETYSDPEKETAVVRERVGVMDISANSKVTVRISGPSEKAAQDVIADIIRIANMDLFNIKLTSNEYLLVGPPSREGEVMQSLKTKVSELENDQLLSIIDQTDGLAGLLVAGPHGRDLLSKLCAISFHPADFPNLQAAQSSLAKVHAVILRRDLADLPAFELYFERPYGLYIWDAVLDAGAEFGLAPFGWAGKLLLDFSHPNTD